MANNLPTSKYQCYETFTMTIELGFLGTMHKNVKYISKDSDF
jgi:hypothetical protein